MAEELREFAQHAEEGVEHGLTSTVAAVEAVPGVRLVQDQTRLVPEINPFGGGGGQRGPGAGRGPGGQRGGNEGMGFGIGRMVGPAFFTAGDADKDGSLTRAELSDTFGKWFASWDTNKTDALTEQQFRDGFAASMPRGGGGRGPGGPGGPGGFGGGFAGFGFGRTALAQQMITQGDTDKNEKLSKSEFMAMADVWFDKVDAAKSGKVNQAQFSAKLAEALGMPAEPAPAAPQAGARAEPPEPPHRAAEAQRSHALGRARRGPLTLT